MDKRLLVTTDFSTSSKAGIRFALQLAEQTNYGVVIYHCLPYLKPTRWSDARYEAYAKDETEKALAELGRVVRDIFRTSRIRKRKVVYVVEHKPDVAKAIVGQAVRIGAKAICMSTRGAGILRKTIGTYTSDMVQSSPLPLFVVPKDYKKRKISHILFASDLSRLKSELKQVRELARLLNAKVSVVHYDYMADVEEARKKLTVVAKRYKYPNIKFRIQKYSVDKSLAWHMLRDMAATKASLAVLFTNQKRGWFDRLFLSSKSVDVAYNSRVPLLVIPRS